MVSAEISCTDQYVVGNQKNEIRVLLDFSLTVKAATFGVVQLFHLLRKGNQVLFIIWYRVDKLFEPHKRACIS